MFRFSLGFSLIFQIITTEAEGPPSPDHQPSGNTKHAQSENKPGMLSFLNAQEQLKVQKLLAAYEKGDGKEVGVQTEQTVLQPHHLENVFQPHMHRLKNVLESLETKLDFHERKLDSILSLLTTVPANKPKQQEELFNCNDLLVVRSETPPHADLPVLPQAAFNDSTPTSLIDPIQSESTDYSS